jgi:hypothetical protein
LESTTTSSSDNIDSDSEYEFWIMSRVNDKSAAEESTKVWLSSSSSRC